MRNFLHRIILILSFFFFFISCLTTLTRVSPTEGFNLEEVDQKIKRDLNKNNARIYVDLVCDKTVSALDCDHFTRDLKELKNFTIDNSSAMQLRINFLEKPKDARLYYSDWFIGLTLGIFPLIDEWKMKIRFDLFSKTKKRIMKSYSYDAQKTEYGGWVAPFLFLGALPFWATGYYENIAFFSKKHLRDIVVQKLHSELQILSVDERISNELQTKEEFIYKPVLVIYDTNTIGMKEEIESRIRKSGIPTVEKTKKGIEISYEAFTEAKRIANRNPYIKSGIYTLVKIESNNKTDTNVQIIDVETGEIIESFISQYEISPNDYYYDNLTLEIVRIIKIKAY